MMWILQLSDIHLAVKEGCKVNRADFLKLMNEKIKESVDPAHTIIVTVCGDITYKGDPRGYGPANVFFQKMKDTFDHDIVFCPCPGNHDVTSDKANYFNGFNEFVWDLTNEADISFSMQNTAVCKSLEDIDMILVNSAYHGDCTYGLVKLDDLEAALESSKSLNRIIVTHHHSISMDQDNRSAIANAYRFLQLAVAYEVKAILHGHRHMETILLVGKNKCRLIGVGSLFFRPGYNLNNQFNVIKYENGSIKEAYTYRYVGDLHEHGRVGGFHMDHLRES